MALGRRLIRAVLDGKDRRLFLVVGPCSIHDPKAALEYAGRLKRLADRVADRFVIAMRVYFEKPRTAVGWKGLINDPDMDGSFRVEEGLKRARRLLRAITESGLFTASEALDPITPQYLSELVCELASGLSSPVGFKNGTDGNVQAAVDAARSALRPHHFFGVDPDGRTSIFRTRGNAYGHVVLRGGRKPNFDGASVRRCALALAAAGVRRKIMIDCSHGNSGKEPRRQPAVFAACLEQARRGASCVMGMMVESNLREGSQPIPPGHKPLSRLRYGVSVTDPCLGWAATEAMILGARR